MNNNIDVTPDEAQRLFDKLQKEAEVSGYHLNPDGVFVKELIRGLIVNQKRYGYGSCPCRLSEGDKWKDMDIICPCDYRDPDLNEFGACYCALYVSESVAKSEKHFEPVPERRWSSHEKQTRAMQTNQMADPGKLSYPVWRCKVCGFLCAREQPPDSCPICKAEKNRFERFL
jgi:ferredoxin-thioredoxin reductase catalytic subunit